MEACFKLSPFCWTAAKTTFGVFPFEVSLALLLLALRLHSIQTARMNDISISSLLIGISIVGGIGTTVVLSVEEKRWNVAIITIVLSAGSIVILAQLSLEKSEYIQDSLQTIIGTIIGVAFALWITFHVIVLIEKNAALPKSTKPITDEEKDLVKRHLEANIGGMKNE